MGDSLSNSALDLMKFGPIFLLVNGYWILSNK
jgi:hypothetical protein